MYFILPWITDTVTVKECINVMRMRDVKGTVLVSFNPPLRAFRQGFGH